MSDYPKLIASFEKLSKKEKKGHLRNLCRTDLYFLLRYGFGRKDVENQWLYQRCIDVQNEPDGYLDLWSREHYKSTIITYTKTIQDILASHGTDPIIEKELTFGIFSHTRPIAKAFMRQIKQEFEQNQTLKEWFPDVLWENPSKQAPKWSEDDGITVIRKSNPKEQTVEAWGVVDGQPTSKHFDVLIYDDLVTKESVSTPEQIKKTTDSLALSYNLGSHGGKKRFIGTRYHYNDSYKTLMDRGTVKKRIFPATDDGTVAGNPVFLSQESLDEKRRDMGPYIFACFSGGTKVSMSDWSEKLIQDIFPGDEVVGYEFGKDGKRTRLVKSKVLARSVRRKPVVRITFESGRYVVCTEDHKFFSGRPSRGYAPLSVGKKHGRLSAACSIYNPNFVRAKSPDYEAGYLAAMVDGEGCITGNTVHIAQCRKTNPETCEMIEIALDACIIPWSCTNPTSRPHHNDYYVTGGRESKIRLVNLLRKSGKIDRIIDSIYQNGTRNIGHRGSRDKVVLIEPFGDTDVYNIQTETGNYIAEGYAVKNCQMLQDPKQDDAQGFKEEWLKYYRVQPIGCNVYVLVDPANSKKKDSDYTAIFVVGLGADKNYYVLDMVRDRLNLKERTRMVFDLHKRWQPLATGYERFGMQTDIEHIEEKMETENYRFNLVALGQPGNNQQKRYLRSSGGQMSKEDRVKKLIPLFEQGRVWLPENLYRVNYEGVREDLVKVFIDDEYLPFPVGIHPDMLDALARVLDDDLNAQFPIEKKIERISNFRTRAKSDWRTM